MKKILAVFTLIVLMFTFTGCNKDADDNISDSDTELSRQLIASWYMTGDENITYTEDGQFDNLEAVVFTENKIFTFSGSQDKMLKTEICEFTIKDGKIITTVDDVTQAAKIEIKDNKLLWITDDETLEYNRIDDETADLFPMDELAFAINRIKTASGADEAAQSGENSTESSLSEETTAESETEAAA